MPGNAITPVLRRLTSAGLLVHAGENRLVPGRDLENILLVDVLGAVRNGGNRRLILKPPRPVDAVVAEIESSVSAVLANRTLRSLLTDPPAELALSAEQPADPPDEVAAPGRPY